MMKLWLSQKFRFLSHVGCFVGGIALLVLPWFLGLLFIAGALALDYVAFRFEYSE
ncbi:MAG: hypothetical protein J6C34_06395 [Oscillospiraceae bacterium]|nr:hypothetical protein [Oscillospiraceae bacterium]